MRKSKSSERHAVNRSEGGKNTILGLRSRPDERIREAEAEPQAAAAAARVRKMLRSLITFTQDFH